MTITRDSAPVLILGGYGSLGSRIARTLRRLHPRLPITIAGRDLQKAEALACEIGAADAIAIDLCRPDLGLPAARQFSAVVAALRDTSLNALRHAQRTSVPYLALSDAPFEIGPLVARYAHHPTRSVIVLIGHGIGGVPALVARHYARQLHSVERIDIGLVFDPDDPFGRMSAIDMQHIVDDGPPPLMLQRGVWRWGDPHGLSHDIRGVGGLMHTGQCVGLLDPLSLANVAPDASIRVVAAQGLTHSRRNGGRPSHEVIIEITGTAHDGRVCQRIEIVDPDGYAALSARGITLALERVIGQAGGTPPPPGLYFPESLVDTGHLIARLASFGVALASTETHLERGPAR